MNKQEIEAEIKRLTRLASYMPVKYGTKIYKQIAVLTKKLHESQCISKPE